MSALLASFLVVPLALFRRLAAARFFLFGILAIAGGIPMVWRAR